MKALELLEKEGITPAQRFYRVISTREEVTPTPNIAL